jgi:hypothetical protein
MTPSKSRKNENASRRATRGKSGSSKDSGANQSKSKKMPSKAVLRQLAKDWDHVT